MPTLFYSPGAVKYVYRPEGDITPNEIAQLTPILIGLLHSPEPEPWVHHRGGPVSWDDTIDELPVELRRHFKVEATTLA